MTTLERLTITDGTVENTVSLYAAAKGAHVSEWLPKSPQPANNILASSPYVDGKHLISKTYDNIIDTFVIAVDAEDQDGTIHELNKFIKLLEKAVKYWTDEYNSHPFWIEARSPCETNIRYAYVADYSLPEIPNPYDPPFIDGPSAISEVSLSIEHTIWADELEIGSNCIAIKTPAMISQVAVQVTPAASNDDGGGYIQYHYIPPGAPTTSFSIVGTFHTIGVNDIGYPPGPVADSLQYKSGIRFIGINIPKDAIITGAYLKLVSTRNDSAAGIQVDMHGEDNSHPAIFSTYADFDGRTRTGAAVSWYLSSWSLGTAYDSPELKTIIQEIVNRVDWVSGHNLALLLDFASSGMGYRMHDYASWDNATYTEPTLYITYQSSDIVPGEHTPTCLRGPTVANYDRPQSITHAYWHDISLATWSANLVGSLSAVDYNLWPAAPAATDELYFGIASGAQCAPINNIVINLASGDLAHVHREYWNGAWVSLGDAVFWNAGDGIHVDAWTLPADATTTTVNGVLGYWIRYVIQTVGASVPQQKAYTIPYTVTWSNIIIENDQIHGNINSIIDLLLATRLSDASKTTLGQTHILVSARKTSRDCDSKFYPYIPLNIQLTLAEGTYVTLGSGGSDTVDYTAYSGRSVQYSPAGAGSDDIAIVYLNAKTYAGRYRAVVRGRSCASMAVGEGGLFIRVNTYTGTYDTPTVYNRVGAASSEEFWDLGIITLPSDILYEDKGTIEAPVLSHTLTIYYVAKGAYTSATAYDLVLMPVDEAHVELSASSDTGKIMSFQYPWKLVSSNAKVGAYAFILKDRNGTADMVTVDWEMQTLEQIKADILGKFELEQGVEYYLYFYMYKSTPDANGLFSGVIMPSFDKHDRYLLLRGDE